MISLQFQNLWWRLRRHTGETTERHPPDRSTIVKAWAFGHALKRVLIDFITGEPEFSVYDGGYVKIGSSRHKKHEESIRWQVSAEAGWPLEAPGTPRAGRGPTKVA
jgi:hypothetical protein